jgi:UDP-N-acetylmuramoylalanine--D-glutamate ligase
MELKGKKVLVVGIARTGVEAARFAARQGARVIVTDRKEVQELQHELASLAGLAVTYRPGSELSACLEGTDYVVPSPGVPPENALLREACRRQIEILSEIELAARFIETPLIAITGTNGKSTTTSLIGEILKASGMRVFVGGNIGTPLIRFVSDRWDCGVVEISSFQLEWTKRFRPKVAVLLNLSEDHLDRYAGFAAYCAAKERIFSQQQADDTAILNRDDPWVWRARKRIKARVISFGWDAVPDGVFAAPDKVIWKEQTGAEAFSLERVKLTGVHNVENVMAAVAAAKVIGADSRAIRQAIESFRGLEHRLEFVCEKNGVRYYNDSKGTNVGAVVKSLMSFSTPVILLAGGVDKHGDYGILADEIRRTVKKLVLFGAARERIRDCLGHLTDTVAAASFADAVREAYLSATRGDAVLLSPACSSFDMFQNYEERGRVFKELVRKL